MCNHDFDVPHHCLNGIAAYETMESSKNNQIIKHRYVRPIEGTILRYFLNCWKVVAKRIILMLFSNYMGSKCQMGTRAHWREQRVIKRNKIHLHVGVWLWETGQADTCGSVGRIGWLNTYEGTTDSSSNSHSNCTFCWLHCYFCNEDQFALRPQQWIPMCTYE